MATIELKNGQLFKFYNLEFVIDELLGYEGYGQVHKINRGNIESALKSFLIENIYHFKTQPGYRSLLNESKIYLKMERRDNVALFLSFMESKSGEIYAIFELLKDGNLLHLLGENGLSDLRLFLDIAIDIASGRTHTFIRFVTLGS